MMSDDPSVGVKLNTHKPTILGMSEPILHGSDYSRYVRAHEHEQVRDEEHVHGRPHLSRTHSSGLPGNPYASLQTVVYGLFSAIKL